MDSFDAQVDLDARFERWEMILQDGTFEESLGALEEIAKVLDEGSLTLEQSLRCYELGVLMSRRCEKMIDEAELRISRLTLDYSAFIDDPLNEDSDTDADHH